MRDAHQFLTAPVLGLAQELTLTPVGEASEVVTGRRPVIDCLWSPVAKAAREAGRER